MGRLFGTDGIRGVANRDLSIELAQEIGMALATVLHEKQPQGAPRVYIGRDTRISGDMLEAALTAGLTGAGVDVVSLGVLPTPAVSFLTSRAADIAAGIMISASHNPYNYNGIKIFGADGYKLTDAEEAEMESMILDHARQYVPAGADTLGRRSADTGAAERYIEYIAATAGGKLGGIRVLADCANGSASVTARRLFDILGIEADIVCDAPDGLNINDGCGSTHIGALARRVVSGGYDIGVAFDGDADRCLAVDEKGNEVSGDQIMAVLGLALKEQGRLAKDTIVATVMSNLGFFNFAKAHGIATKSTKVGDRYVLEAMRAGGYILGGENSGHIIFGEYMPTGDGQLTAVQLLCAMKRSGKPLSELCGCVRILPQVMQNVSATVDMKNNLAQSVELMQYIHDREDEIEGRGRILIRPSGTEPLIRVMAEGDDMDMITDVVARIAAAITEYLA